MSTPVTAAPELTVKVTYDYDNTTYNWIHSLFTECARSATTTKSGPSVFINGEINGEHFVFVYPIWKSGSVRYDGACFYNYHRSEQRNST